MYVCINNKNGSFGFVVYICINNKNGSFGFVVPIESGIGGGVFAVAMRNKTLVGFEISLHGALP